MGSRSSPRSADASGGRILHAPLPNNIPFSRAYHSSSSTTSKRIAFLAEVEIRRYGMENVSQALRDMRHERGRKQTEVSGLSERHVRRLEKEEIRLTVEAASKFARALGLTLSEFMDELSGRITGLRRTACSAAEREKHRRR